MTFPLSYRSRSRSKDTNARNSGLAGDPQSSVLIRHPVVTQYVAISMTDEPSSADQCCVWQKESCGFAGTRGWVDYISAMAQEALGPVPNPASPRMTVIRSFPDVKATIGMLNAGRPVFLVLRTSEGERTRVLDLLAGWSLGSGGDVDKISPSTLLAIPQGAGPVRLGGTGLVSAVNEVFNDGPAALNRKQEERLVACAASGDANARRRLVDTYAELATLLALRLRPDKMSEAAAVAAAQQELDRVVGTVYTRRPLLAALLDGLLSRLIA
jgi:hypothetical protein